MFKMLAYDLDTSSILNCIFQIRACWPVPSRCSSEWDQPGQGRATEHFLSCKGVSQHRVSLCHIKYTPAGGSVRHFQNISVCSIFLLPSNFISPSVKTTIGHKSGTFCHSLYTSKRQKLFVLPNKDIILNRFQSTTETCHDDGNIFSINNFSERYFFPEGSSKQPPKRKQRIPIFFKEKVLALHIHTLAGI